MKYVHKILGQSAPVATVPTAAYIVPSGEQAIVSTINVCNSGGVTDKFRLWAVKAGDTVSSPGILYWDVDVVPGNNTFQTTAGITLQSAESIWCYSLLGTSSFNVFGKESE